MQHSTHSLLVFAEDPPQVEIEALGEQFGGTLRCFNCTNFKCPLATGADIRPVRSCANCGQGMLLKSTVHGSGRSHA